MATTQQPSVDLSKVPGGLFLSADGTYFVNGKGERIKDDALPKGAELLVKRPAEGGPAPTATAAGPGAGLPDDYPEADRWREANLTTRAAVEGKTDAELIKLPGIGTATVAKMREYATRHPLPAAS